VLTDDQKGYADLSVIKSANGTAKIQGYATMASTDVSEIVRRRPTHIHTVTQYPDSANGAAVRRCPSAVRASGLPGNGLD
jgi:hypothetical protein